MIYWFVKRPTSWRVNVNVAVEGRYYFRCETIAEVRQVVKDLRLSGARSKNRRYTHWSIADAQRLREIDAMAGETPALAESVKTVLRVLRALNPNERTSATRDVVEGLLRQMDCDGMVVVDSVDAES